MFTTTITSDGKVYIPRNIRDQLKLEVGTILRIKIEGKRIVLEPIEEPPKEIFINVDSSLVEDVVKAVKSKSDKTIKILKALGVEIG